MVALDSPVLAAINFSLQSASAQRLWTRHAVSLVFELPLSYEARIASLLPAEKASAEAALAQAEVDLDKTVVRAGVDGLLEFSGRVVA